ncbi:hypothetical protein CL617_03600 [archaeon]|nr:hypothetical protein [archaeon]|tara:strand:+ start:378 stop:1361 length:984 start_codon:yes stop_codon:yes gene_type:complete
MKRIVFRVEGNNKVGMGHTFTPLRIADKIKDEIEVLFVMSSESKLGMNVVKDRGYNVKEVDFDDIKSQIELIKEYNPNVVFNDLLYANKAYMELLKENNIFIINMEHSQETDTRNIANVVINSLYPGSRKEYYYGPKYALLSDSYKNLPKRILNKENKRIFVCFGGSDLNSLTLKTVNALKDSNLELDIVMVPNFKYKNELEKINSDYENVNLHEGLSDLSKLMLNADVGIVSGGYTSFECAATGLPILVLAQNELEDNRNKLFVEFGTSVYLGLGTKILEEELRNEVNKLNSDYNLREKMNKKGQELVDGKGLDRVVDIVKRNFNE